MLSLNVPERFRTALKKAQERFERNKPPSSEVTLRETSKDAKALQLERAQPIIQAMRELQAEIGERADLQLYVDPIENSHVQADFRQRPVTSTHEVAPVVTIEVYPGFPQRGEDDEDYRVKLIRGGGENVEVYDTADEAVGRFIDLVAEYLAKRGE